MNMHFDSISANHKSSAVRERNCPMFTCNGSCAQVMTQASPAAVQPRGASVSTHDVSVDYARPRGYQWCNGKTI